MNMVKQISMVLPKLFNNLKYKNVTLKCQLSASFCPLSMVVV